jgi:hypothetical protein
MLLLLYPWEKANGIRGGGPRWLHGRNLNVCLCLKLKFRCPTFRVTMVTETPSSGIRNEGLLKLRSLSLNNEKSKGTNL